MGGVSNCSMIMWQTLVLALLAPTISALVTRPHILLIVADDLGHNDVGFHSTDGNTQIPTPSLDKLAKAGVQLENYYVQPVCSPTRSCLMTGRHVIHTGIYDPDCDPGTTLAVPRNFSMLPQQLKALNYSTVAIGKWHLGMFSPSVLPTGRGFDSFFGYYGGAEDYFTHKVQAYLDLHDDNIPNGISPAYGYEQEYSTHLYTRKAVGAIGQHAATNGASSPLFMYLAYQAIHSPDEAPSSYSDRFSDTIPNKHRRTVAGMVAALDEGIGNVTEALKKNGMLEHTTIVFTTDNGGPAQGFNKNMASNWPLRGMKRTLWEGGVRANGFVSGAGLKKSGYTSDALLHAVDIPISLLALATNGLEADPSDAASWKQTTHEPPLELGDGLDAWRTLATGAKSPRTEIIHEAHPTGPQMNGTDDGNGQAIRVGDFKLIYEKGPEWHGPPNDLWYESFSEPLNYTHTVKCGPIPSSTSEDYCHPDKLPCLFNVKEDPCEYKDLSRSMPHKVHQLIARLRVYQRTSVSVNFHKLVGTNCTSADPSKHPEWNNTWMPNCA